MTDLENKNSLDVIERAQFIISLDSSHPGINPYSPATVDEMSIMSGRCLHGNGSAYDSCNRWFDLALQVCDGSCFLTYVRLFAYSYLWHQMEVMDLT